MRFRISSMLVLICNPVNLWSGVQSAHHTGRIGNGIQFFPRLLPFIWRVLELKVLATAVTLGHLPEDKNFDLHSTVSALP